MDLHYIINLLDFKEFQEIQELDQQGERCVGYRIIVNENEYIDYVRHDRRCKYVHDDDDNVIDQIVENDCYHIMRFLNNELKENETLIIDRFDDMFEKAVTGEKMIKSHLGLEE